MNTDRSLVPVLEIGGTHVTAALVAASGEDGRPAVIEQHRRPLDSAADAASIVEDIVNAGERLSLTAPTRWGVAIPGPFDYRSGIGRFEGVAKFDSLNGYDLGLALRSALGDRMADVAFVNDATAFGLGECAAGAGRRRRRVICLTLGTGIGSAFIADGVAIDSGDSVPPHGWVYLLDVGGAPIEDVVSRRAMRDAYQRASGELVDVREIADRARLGDAAATRVFETTMTVLGRAIAPWVERFQATAIVIGGSIAGAWDLIADPLRDALVQEEAELRQASLGSSAPLVGAAAYVLQANDRRERLDVIGDR